MNLVRAEFRRLFARRLIRVAVTLVLMIMASMLVTTAYGSRPSTPAERTVAEQAALRDTVGVADAKKNCLDAKAAGGKAAEAYRKIDCQQQFRPPTVSNYLRPPYVFQSRAGDLIQVLTALLGISLLVMGASFVGAEWNHGTMTSLLAWEPRRLRVFLGKLIGLLVGCVVICAFTYGVTLGASYLIATSFGGTPQLTAETMRTMGFSVVRGTAIGLAAAAVGFAVASVARMSAAAMGLALAYILGAEVGLRLADERTERWLLSTNISAWQEHGTSITLAQCGGSGGCVQQLVPVSMWQGGIYLAAITLVMVVIATVVFLRRDVT